MYINLVRYVMVEGSAWLGFQSATASVNSMHPVSAASDFGTCSRGSPRFKMLMYSAIRFCPSIEDGLRQLEV